MSEPVILWHDDVDPDDAGWYSVQIGPEMAEYRALPRAEFDSLRSRLALAEKVVDAVRKHEDECGDEPKLHVGTPPGMPSPMF